MAQRETAGSTISSQDLTVFGTHGIFPLANSICCLLTSSLCTYLCWIQLSPLRSLKRVSVGLLRGRWLNILRSVAGLLAPQACSSLGLQAEFCLRRQHNRAAHFKASLWGIAVQWNQIKMDTKGDQRQGHSEVTNA